MSTKLPRVPELFELAQHSDGFWYAMMSAEPACRYPKHEDAEGRFWELIRTALPDLIRGAIQDQRARMLRALADHAMVGDEDEGHCKLCHQDWDTDIEGGETSYSCHTSDCMLSGVGVYGDHIDDK